MIAARNFTFSSYTAFDQAGYRFGEIFLKPQLEESGRRTLTVSVYGPQDSGKTAFALAWLFRDENAFARQTVSARIGHGCRAIAFAVKDYPYGQFRYGDLGARTYPRHLPDWAENIRTPCCVPARNEGLGAFGLDLFEHAPFPLLAQSDLVVLVTPPQEIATTPYFGRMETALRAAIEGSTEAAEKVTPILDAMQEFRQSAVRYRRQGTEKPVNKEERLVTLLVPQATEALANGMRAFCATLAEDAETSLPRPACRAAGGAIPLCQ